MKTHLKILIYMFLGTLLSCQEPYVAEYTIDDNTPVLIVEGFINVDGNSQFKLSETVPLSSENAVSAIKNASLTIELSDGSKINSVSHFGEGKYLFEHPALPRDKEYRLHVKIGTKEYRSNFVAPLISPEITSIDWAQVSDGLEIYTSTKNADSNSPYYRWEFEENWRFSPPLRSVLIYDGSSVRFRNAQENITFCYLDNKSSDILLGNTESLGTNAISKQKIQHIPSLSEKLQYRYSILVKQYSISRESFLYWSILKKNSESIGDIFGSMPSELNSNIKSITNEREPVIGMIEAGNVSTKRIFINQLDFEYPWVVQNPFYSGCREVFEIPAWQANGFFRDSPNAIPVYEIFKCESCPYPTDYAFAYKECVDCRVRGSVTPPDFWLDN